MPIISALPMREECTSRTLHSTLAFAGVLLKWNFIAPKANQPRPCWHSVLVHCSRNWVGGMLGS